MQFPVEMVREVAQLLKEASLGEISLEQTEGGSRLSVKRAVYSTPTASHAPVFPPEDAVAEAIAVAAEAVEAAKMTIESPAVGVFRASESPLEVGTEVKKKSLLGAVETLNIPTELYAPDAGRVIEILVTDGQGVEWGQPLIIIEPLEK